MEETGKFANGSNMRKMAVVAALTAAMSVAGARSWAQFPAAPGTGPGLAETVEAIDSARVTTRILYVTAHPDDESGAVLTYLARGLHADVALLSLTRGEGGQNALGPEQAPQLGLIRTQELLAATRGYGVKLYFTRAKDFGFSKTPEEAEKVWGDQVVEDMVRVIREFRPNIVINGWGGVHQGHGHHQAAGLLTPKAVVLAADESYLSPLSRNGLATWGGKDNPVQILDVDRGSDHPSGYVLPLDDVSPLWAKSWRELGLDAFANHRTQGVAGFLGSPFLKRPIGLKLEAGGDFDSAALARPLSELLGTMQSATCKAHRDWCETIVEADREIVAARAQALQLNWSEAVDLLAKAEAAIGRLRTPNAKSSYGPLGPENEGKVLAAAWRISRATSKASGFQFVAEANRGTIVRGEPVLVTVKYGCRPGVKCWIQTNALESFSFSGLQSQDSGSGDPSVGIKYSTIAAPAGFPGKSGRNFAPKQNLSPARRFILEVIPRDWRSLLFR